MLGGQHYRSVELSVLLQGCAVQEDDRNHDSVFLACLAVKVDCDSAGDLRRRSLPDRLHLHQPAVLHLRE